MSKLRTYREKAGLTQEQLGKRCGFLSPQSRVALYESGGRTPTLIVSRILVSALQASGVTCSLDDVFPPQQEQLKTG
ncbi:helix-turn-helix transcriptional regulator [Reinekea sp.]|jgi:putative transcriptional regulator|uniref:helix-turn-helix transcriptional regulator n=1 Tax=Reinekea sp. TaxID=1970455 RepID=UPI003989F1E5